MSAAMRIDDTMPAVHGSLEESERQLHELLRHEREAYEKRIAPILRILADIEACKPKRWIFNGVTYEVLR